MTVGTTMLIAGTGTLLMAVLTRGLARRGNSFLLGVVCFALGACLGVLVVLFAGDPRLPFIFK